MPTSSYMVDVKVEIAFNAGFLTAAASRTWTDVSAYVELEQGLTITHGRQDDRTQADANHLTLTLDNSDGRFTPGKTGGAYYPNVKLDRPIRVTETPVDGSAQTAGIFFIDEWPVSWESTDGYSYVTISASSRLARLGMVAGLKSIVEMAILADGPAAYYTLGEPTDAVAAVDSSGNRANPLTLFGDIALPLVFGTATGPGTDGLTATQFVGGQYLSGGSTFAWAGGGTLETFALRESVPTAAEAVAGLGTASVGFSSTGAAVASLSGTAVITGAIIADNNTHHLALSISAGGTWTLYVDGVSAGTSASGVPAGSNSLVIGSADGTAVVAFLSLTGVAAHAAFFQSALTAPQILAHSTAGLTGYAGETTSARLIRYAGYAGVPSADISAETGQTTVQHVDTTDKQAVEMMRLMETTEGGVVFDDRDGTTAFHNRAHRLTSSAAFTLDMSLQMVESDYQPKLDRSALANDITAADTSGRFNAHVIDATSRNIDNGVATLSIETASSDDDEPLFLASWALYKYKTPLPRVATLTVNCLAQVGKTPNCATVLAANVGTKLTVSNRPSQDSASSASFFVEGYTRVYGPESCMTTFNVSPSSPEDNTYIVGNATGRGVIGTNPIAL